MKDFALAASVAFPSSSILARMGAGLAAMALGIALSACGSGGDRKPNVPPHLGAGGEGGAGIGPGGASGTGGRVDGGPDCEAGEQKECTVYVEQASGVTSCWKGVKFCVDGEFSECLEPGAVFPTTGADPS
jgi:hypothetical protein